MATVTAKVNEQAIYDVAALHSARVERKGKSVIVVETDDIKVQIHTFKWGEKPKKARIYVSGEQDVDFSAANELGAKLGTFARGESEELDAMFDKLNRQVVKNQKSLILETIEKVEAFRLLIADAKFGFWKTAGCSCSCSPGWIVDGKIALVSPTNYGFEETLYVSEIYITKK